MSAELSEGTLLWQPTESQRAQSNLARYMAWLRDERGQSFASYDELWRWSTTDLTGFWRSIWDYFEVKSATQPSAVLTSLKLPGAQWFPGATLNYVEQALRRCDDHVALLHRDEGGAERRVTYRELNARVAAMAQGLRELGVQKGDRVAGYVPNVPEAVIAFLATASLGAIWSSCSPEFGAGSVLDRLQQIGPKVLFAVDGYRYGGKRFERADELRQIIAGLPTLETAVLLPSDAGPLELPKARPWRSLERDGAALRCTPVNFEHALWILYSSGTTGLPKPIVHSHGGILLEHLKAVSLHCDVRPTDRFFWYSTTGWMMWNFVLGGLLVGATVVTYDGSPGWPDLDVLWRMAAAVGVTYFGTSAPYLMACQKAGLDPGSTHDLSALRAVGSTGAPLPVEGFGWVYEHVKRDVLLGSVSGGTDMCTAFVLSCPLLPVHAGELQCAGLGHLVQAFDAKGKPVVGEVGELVLSAPAPSMPVFFWNDPDGARLRESYFAAYPGVWRHGDWIKFTARGSAVIYGRSDSTLNRGGVRMGTSEFYRVVEAIPEVQDSVVVDTGMLGREDKLWLFVVLKPGCALDERLTAAIKAELRRKLSPRHVPDELRAVSAVPRTLNGKKLEVPIKKILTGTPVSQAANPDTLQDPKALEPFAAFAAASGSAPKS